jgi:gliding motility-associated-like protein
MKNWLITFLIFFSQFLCAQNIKWAQKIGGTASDFARGIATDNKGNTFIIGGYNGSLVLPGTQSAASRTITAAGQRDIFLTKLDCNKNMVWKNTIGGNEIDAGRYAMLKVRYDKKKHIYATGSFNGTATFTTTSGASQTLVSNGGDDVFLAKYDTSGILIWVVKSGGSSGDEGIDCCFDKYGKILLCGVFQTTTTFGSRGGSSVNLISAGGEDAFISKYDTSGLLLWVKRGGGALADNACNITTDNQNNIYFGGGFGCCNGAPASFGTLTINNTGNWGGYIAKADENGNYVWLNGLGGVDGETIVGCVVDSLCNVYIQGSYGPTNTSLSSTFPGSSFAITGTGSIDAYYAKFDSAGVLGWVRPIGGTGTESTWDLLINKENQLISSGYFNNTVNFGNGYNLVSAGLGDAFVLTLNGSNGNTINALRFGGTAEDFCFGSALDNSGNLYSCGFFNNTSSFGLNSLTSLGTEDAYFVKIAPTNKFKLKPVTLSLCNGDSALLRPLDTLSGLTFQWFRNNNIIAGANQFSYSAKLAGSYFLRVTNNCNEIDSSETITLNISTGTVNAGIDQTICQGDSVQLLASGASTYFWSPATGISNRNIANPWVKPTDSTIYVIKATLVNCSFYDTIMVNVIKTAVNADSDKGICPNDSVQLNGSGMGVLTWNTSPFLSNILVLNPYAKPTLTTKFVLMANLGTCTNYDTVEVMVSLPLILNAGIDQSICIGDSINLIATGGFNYNWNYNLTLNDTNIFNPFAKPKLNTKYIVKSGLSNCRFFDTIAIEVNSLPIVNAGNDTIICKGLPFQLNGHVQQADLFSWSPTTNLNNASLQKPIILFPTTEKYYFSAENTSTKCKAKDSVFIQVDSVIALFTTNTHEGIAPLSVVFTNKSVNANAYLWTFENSNTSNRINPIYNFNDTGEYAVVLFAKNDNDCEDTAMTSIFVYDEIKFQIPNVFSPNGDILNDYFENKISNYKMLKHLKGTIWNRWGQQIYEYQMPNGQWWDGSYEGQQCVDGVYFYVIEAETINGKKYSFHGTVTLLR